MKRYNVLYMSMSGEMVGGGQKSLYLLLERLNKEKYRPFLICPSYGGFVKKVEKLGIETSLLITGKLRNPNILAFISTIRKLKIFIKVLLTGYREDIPPLINLMDIVVLPSIHPEGLSRLSLEAMASSKPMITSAVGGNLESVEDGTTGLIVNPRDVNSLSHAILELAQNEKLRNQMGAAGRRRAEELFSIDQNVAQTERVYEEVLCRNM